MNFDRVIHRVRDQPQEDVVIGVHVPVAVFVESEQNAIANHPAALVAQQAVTTPTDAQSIHRPRQHAIQKCRRIPAADFERFLRDVEQADGLAQGPVFLDHVVADIVQHQTPGVLGVEGVFVCRARKPGRFLTMADHGYAS